MSNKCDYFFSAPLPGRYRTTACASMSFSENATRLRSPLAKRSAWSACQRDVESGLSPYASTEYALGTSVNSTASTHPSPPLALNFPSGSRAKLRTRKQPNAPPHPPTGTSTEPRRTRCTSPQVTSQRPYRRAVSVTAQANASAAFVLSLSPTGVRVGSLACHRLAYRSESGNP